MSNSFIDHLEPRQFLSVSWHDGTTVSWGDYSITLRFGVLTVRGSSRNDNITVWPQMIFDTSGSTPVFQTRSLLVLMGGKNQNIPINLVKTLQISGGGGDDMIQLQAQATFPSSRCPSDSSFSSIAQERPARIDGGDGDDTIIGTNLNDTLSGGRGDDSIAANGGNDQISGDAGNDTITGGAGGDHIDGGGGNDNIRGSTGRDVLIGGDGSDTLIGGAGADQIFGGNGIDWADQKPSAKRSIERQASKPFCVDPVVTPF